MCAISLLMCWSLSPEVTIGKKLYPWAGNYLDRCEFLIVSFLVINCEQAVLVHCLQLSGWNLQKQFLTRRPRWHFTAHLFHSTQQHLCTVCRTTFCGQALKASSLVPRIPWIRVLLDACRSCWVIVGILRTLEPWSRSRFQDQAIRNLTGRQSRAHWTYQARVMDGTWWWSWDRVNRSQVKLK